MCSYRMLQQCFTFLPGIGMKTIEHLGAQSIVTWNDFLHVGKIKGISTKRKAYYDRQLQQAQRAVEQDNIAYFVDRLPQREMWRLYSRYKDSCCFVDCEVDSKGMLIVVTVSDRFTSATFIRGMHLNSRAITAMINSYRLIVTYNGSAFDMVKLKKFGVRFVVPHLDLKPLCQRLGLSGGLKDVEEQLGIHRPRHLKGSAVDAWKAFWASGDREWLQLLVAYNEADAVNLHQLAEKCITQVASKI
jgi:uncharacterized protein